MDEQITLPHRNDELLELGTSYEIELDDFAEFFDAAEELSFAWFIASLPVTTTLTELTVTALEGFEPTPESNRRVVEPLCRGIANLRRYNENHPLQTLVVGDFTLNKPGNLDVLEQLLVAAKQGGISRLKLDSIIYLPVQSLVEFCRDNRSLKVLDLEMVRFIGGDALIPTTSAAILILDRLSLTCTMFEDSTAATEFLRFVAHMSVSALELGNITVWNELVDYDDYDVATFSNRIVSELMKPSVEHLKLSSEKHRFNDFRLALEAGATSVIDLVVSFHLNVSDKLEQHYLLGRMIRGSVKLRRLVMHGHMFADALQPPEIFRAVEANATLTEIQVTRFHPEEVQRLQRITSRNVALDRFVASPGTYPPHMLLALMCQLHNCPTGRYMMTRCFPSVFSFEFIKSTKSPTTEPKQKKRKSKET